MIDVQEKESETAVGQALNGVQRQCRSGHHTAGRGTTTDALGVKHGRCRHCGCELAKMPTSPRWYRSGLMG